MLRHSFVFIPGIGRRTEVRLWRRGILTWEGLRSGLHRAGLSPRQQETARDYLDRAQEALARQEIAFFARHLSHQELWRVYGEFRDRTVFLDLETTGLSFYYHRITVVGCYDHRRPRAFIRGQNLEEIARYLMGFDLLVTFNGTLFDLAFLRREFPEITFPPVHLDLRYLLKSLGLGGPLKSIEMRLGLSRPESIRDLDGRQAAALGWRFLRGDQEALARLLLYNRYDTVNLARLMDLAYELKSRQAGFPFPDRLSAPARAPDEPPSEDGEAAADPSPIRLNEAALGPTLRPPWPLEELIRQIQRRGRMAAAIGIDLAAGEAKETGICILRGLEAKLMSARTDEEIMHRVRSAGVRLVSVDAPLGLPAGRCCPDDTCSCRVRGLYRECERELLRRGIRVYPCLIDKMRDLTVRGMRLARRLRGEGLEVIECYPGAAQDILGWPRKGADREGLERELLATGVRIPNSGPRPSHHQLDALTAALVGYFYLAGEYEALGNAEEGYLIIPLNGVVSRQPGC